MQYCMDSCKLLNIHFYGIRLSINMLIYWATVLSFLLWSAASTNLSFLYTRELTNKIHHKAVHSACKHYNCLLYINVQIYNKFELKYIQIWILKFKLSRRMFTGNVCLFRRHGPNYTFCICFCILKIFPISSKYMSVLIE